MFKIAQNETNRKENNTIYKTLKYYLGILSKKMPRPLFHMEKEGGAKI
jgi:hypothetical protein